MFGLSTEEWQSLVLSVGTHRGARRLSPSEVAVLIRRALSETAPEKLAQSLGLAGATWVMRFDSLNRLEPDLRSAISWGQSPASLSMSSGQELARMLNSKRLDSKDATRKAFHAALKHQLTSKEARQLAQAYLRNMGSIEECIEATLKTRVRVESREIILGAILDNAVINKLSMMPPSDRDKLLADVLQDCFKDVNVSSRLNAGFFTLSLDTNNAAKMRSQLGSKSLESTITDALRKHVSP